MAVWLNKSLAFRWIKDSLDLLHGSGSTTRSVPMRGDVNSLWTTSEGSCFQAADTSVETAIPIEPPDGATLTGATVRINPAGGHGALPATMPALRVVRRALATDTVTTLGAQKVDASGNVAAYEPAHELSVDAFSSVVDRATYAYELRIRGEGGTNFVAGLEASCARITFTPPGTQWTSEVPT